MSDLSKIEARVIELMGAGMKANKPTTRDTTLGDSGYDSLDLLELLIELEEEWPDLDLENYEPGLGDTVADVAAEILKRTEGA